MTKCNSCAIISGEKMFTRITTVVKNGQAYRYLSLVENYRQNGKVRQKLIHSLGALTNPATKTAVESLVYKLRRYTNQGFFTPEELSTEKAQLFAPPLVGKFLWDKLQITETIKKLTAGKKIAFDLPLYLLTLTLNHLIAPRSDLAVSRWYKQIYLKELEDKEPHWYNFYRALDYLSRIKEKLEAHLFNQLCDLFSLEVNLVFYDLTTTYFEGQGPEIAKPGYSKEHKKGTRQILVALAITEDGFPIATEIYPGNYPECYTLSTVLANLSQRFKIKRCILVCDRGLVSEKNLKDIKDHGYEYIVALKSRDKKVFKLIDPDLKNYQRLDEHLLTKEISSGEPGKRFIICHNEERAFREAEERQELLDRLTASLQKLAVWYARGEIKDQKEVITRLGNLLSSGPKRKLIRYWFEGKGRFMFEVNKSVLNQEKIIDGKTVIHTEVSDLSSEKIVQTYRSLSRIENCFRDLKSILKIRPLRHYTERRIKAHIFVCVLALLLERMLEVSLARKKYPITATHALEILSEVKITTNTLKNGTREFKVKCVTPIEGQAAKILGYFGLAKVQRTIVTPASPNPKKGVDFSDEVPTTFL